MSEKNILFGIQKIFFWIEKNNFLQIQHKKSLN